MDEVGLLNRAVFRTVLFSAIGALALLAVIAGARSALASGPAPSVSCDASELVYGEPVTCSAIGPDGSSMVWPDGASSPLAEATLAPAAVGQVHVSVIDTTGNVLASTSLAITPDIDLQCDTGEEKTIFELEATDLRSQGWDYVYTDQTTGRAVRPGDPDHPNGGVPPSKLERVELGRANTTKFCKIYSEAADELGGDFEVTLVSPWEGTASHPVRIIGPASKTRWAGTQPAELTGTVAVGGVQASERQNVYMSGCS